MRGKLKIQAGDKREQKMQQQVGFSGEYETRSLSFTRPEEHVKGTEADKGYVIEEVQEQGIGVIRR